MQSDANTINSNADLEETKERQTADVAHQKALIDLEVAKAKELAQIEAKKFGDIVTAIGPQTIRNIAQAGPEMQAKLLQVLGLKGFLITDGTTPINLFNTAGGMVGGLPNIPQHE